MIQAKHDLLQALQAALAALAPDSPPEAAFESPKQAAHGDLAITAAMPLARSLKKNPRELAAALVALLQQQPAVRRWVRALEIAGPGFINLRLLPAARQALVAEVLAAGERFGCLPQSGQKVMVEFVSANPTGPLHVGHGRNAALGDSIGRLLESQGWQVLREFYYNDAGAQIARLGVSVQNRLKGLKPGDDGWPDDAYNGDYIADIAADYAAGKTVRADDREFTASGDPQDLAAITHFAVAYLRHEQDLDLRAFGVVFDHYYLESSLYADGRVEDTVARLLASGKTYEKDGALWLRTTDYGDDKDRVMRRSSPAGVDGRRSAAAGDGGSAYTYFVPDIAYHLAKFERGYAKVINVQGSDHHGTVARVRAGLQAVGAGIPAGYPDYVLYKMITVMKGGQEVKISKRSGSYVTLRDLIAWTSRDAVRFFLGSRKSDSEFVFDVDLALKAGDENPVFYVQYAHARICSVLAQYAAQPGASADLAGADLSLLTAPSEAALMLRLAEYPEMLARAAAELAPHDVAFYLREVAAAFHSYYAAERFLVDDPALARARLALLAATAQVLRNALAVLGVSAPQAMQRDAPVPTPAEATSMKSQRGGFVIGLVVGLLIGLSIALGVALYITKAPVPFMNKVPQRTAEQDNAEAERNKNWDPNAPLGGKAQPPRPAAPMAGASAPPVAAAPALPPPGPASAAKPGRDPAAILAGAAAPTASASRSTASGPEAFVYFVQAGAYTRAEDAEQQRAKLAMMGIESKVTEREQAGRTVLRVRAGPFETRDEADALQVRLTNIAVEARIVRVERQ